MRQPGWLQGAFVLAVASSIALGQEAPWTGPSPAGNWIVEFHNYPDIGKVAAMPMLIREPAGWQCEKAPNGGCYLRQVPDPKANWDVASGLEPGTHRRAAIARINHGGSLIMDHPFFFPLEGARSTFRPVGPDEMRGQWVHGHFHGGQPNNLVWRRRTARIARVKFLSSVESETTPDGPAARVQFTYDGIYWASRTPAYSPGFTAEVYGENLWGHHVVHLPRDVDMIAGGYEFIKDPNGTDTLTGNVIGIRFPVWILGERPPSGDREIPKATPGRKFLLVNEVVIPFQLSIIGFPGGNPEAGELRELRYVEARNGKYTTITGELKHGATFFVEALFDFAPGESQYPVRLSWGEGTGVEVTLRPSSEPTIFRSDAIRLAPPEGSP